MGAAPLGAVGLIKVGIIGTGWGARVQAPAFRDAGFEVAAIAGSNLEKTRRVASELSIPVATADWRQLVEMKEIDLVSVVSPPLLHREMALAVIANRKHLLCEKPTALNAAQAREMADAAGKSSSIAIIDHELRFLPSWIDARKNIAELGSIRFVECRYASASRGDRSREWNWWSDAASGGGVWGAVGSHLIDATRYFAGEVIAVRASLRTYIDTRPENGVLREVTSDDHATAELKLASGASATIQLSVVAATDEPTSITFHGENGGYRFIGTKLLRGNKTGWIEQVDSGEPTAGDSSGGAFGTGTFHLVRALRRAIEGDLEALAPAATMLDGLRQQEVLDAGRLSSSEGGNWVELSAPRGPRAPSHASE